MLEVEDVKEHHHSVLQQNLLNKKENAPHDFLDKETSFSFQKFQLSMTVIEKFGTHSNPHSSRVKSDVRYYLCEQNIIIHLFSHKFFQVASDAVPLQKPKKAKHPQF